MNMATISKLAYGIIWISMLEFSLSERRGFEHTSRTGGRGFYVDVADFPRWETPKANLVQTGSSSWVAITKDITDGIELVQHHIT